MGPEADGYLRAVEELAGEGDHAVHEVGLDEGAADVAFAGLVRRHAAIGEDEAGHALRREVVDEVLHPGEVGVALGRDAELPAHLVILAEPVGVVERRVGEELSFASQKTRQVAARFGFRAHARRGVGAEVGVQVEAEQYPLVKR